jgi:hypothetical protein
MRLSIHYYVLSLSDDSCKLYEGFRDVLITIENGDFPSVPIHNKNIRQDIAHMKDPIKRFYRHVDESFAKYFNQDSLKLILMGQKANQSIYRTVSAHDSDIIGTVNGEFIETSLFDLGQIVWPVVRDALSGDRERALQDMDSAIASGNIAAGLEQVWYLANSQTGCTLLVEDDYHVKGSVMKTDKKLMIMEYVDIMEVFDDVVDAIIEKVLENDGHVIFMDSGSLAKFQQIALIHS